MQTQDWDRIERTAQAMDKTLASPSTKEPMAGGRQKIQVRAVCARL